MLNKITKKEMEQIDFWRLRYGIDEHYDEAINRHFAPAEEWLECWAKNKAFLYKLFGENLIISKNVDLKVADDAVERKMAEYYDKNYWTNDSFVRFIRQFSQQLNLKGMSYDFNRLIGYSVLASNRCNFLDHDQTYVYNLDGVEHKITIHKNEKAMKVIKRIANLIGMDMQLYEEFRIIQSRFTNNANLKGKLCLSIHPLDYMTMSDNECGWHSCMSWRNKGCYRRGTIEMMTSPSVIVAYLESEDGRLQEIEWNSKKWRELFVVNEELITGIKGYPYQYPELETIIINWLKSLYSTEFTPIYHLYDNCQLQENEDINFGFETGWMYNDFGCTYDGCNPICFNIDKYNYLTKNSTLYSTFYYSGPAICVWCGECNDYEEEDDEASCLLCEKCMNSIKFCDKCGEPIPVGAMAKKVHYELYCEWCYNERIQICPITNKEFDQYTDNDLIYLAEGSCDIVNTQKSINAIHNVWFFDEWNKFATTPPHRTRIPSRWGSILVINERDLTTYGRQLFGLTH